MRQLFKILPAFFLHFLCSGQELTILDFDTLDPVQIESSSNWVKFNINIDAEVRSKISKDGLFILCFKQCSDSIYVYSLYPMGTYPPLHPKMTFLLGETDSSLIIKVDHGRLEQNARDEWITLLQIN